MNHQFDRTIRTSDFVTPRTSLEAFGHRASPSDFEQHTSPVMAWEAMLWAVLVLAVTVAVAHFYGAI